MLVRPRRSTKDYEPDGERFPALIFLGPTQSFVCFLVSLLLLLLGLGGGVSSGAPPTKYISLALTNTIGPACGISALKNISYPAQVLAKSCKMVPVMVMGTLVYRKRYSVVEYIATLLIISGVSLFALQKSSSHVSSPNAAMGYVLVLINLILDGYTNSTQDAVKQAYPKTTALQLMCWTNMWCALFGSVYMFGIHSSTGLLVVQFAQSHPQVIIDILVYCLCGAFGQLFIFLTISTFGSLMSTTITTTRKFCSILLSVVWNGNALTQPQWTAVALVFGGLTLKEVWKATSKKATTKKVKGKSE